MTRFKRLSAAVAISGAVLWACAGVTNAASTFNKTTYLKFSGAVGLPGVTLDAGEYVFELVNPDSGRNVVRVMDRAKTKVHKTALTRPTYRPRNGSSSAMVTLGEGRRGSPPPIKAWFPEGETRGFEFIY